MFALKDDRLIVLNKLENGSKLTTRWLDVVNGVSIELLHLRRLGLLVLVAAHGEGVLRHLHQHKVALLPLFPHALADGIQHAAVLHVQRLVHAADNFDAQILVGGVLRHVHLVPLRRSRCHRRRLQYHLRNKLII